MADWAAGLLGGLAGVGNAVDLIGTERRKQLAEHLKLQALEEIEKRADARRHGYAKEIQGAAIASHEKIAGEGRASAEKIAGEQIKSHEKIAGEQNVSHEKIAETNRSSAERIAAGHDQTLKEIHEQDRKLKAEILEHDKSSLEHQLLAAKIKANEESRKIIDGGGTVEEANGIRELAGLPLLERYEMEPKKEGWFSDTPAKMGVRVKPGSTGLIAGQGAGTPVQGPTDERRFVPPGVKAPPAAQTSSDLGSDLQRLLQAGKGTGAVATEKKLGAMGTAEETKPVTETPEKKGIIGSAVAAEVDAAKQGDGARTLPERLNIKGMQVRKSGDKFEVYDTSTKKWRTPTAREQATIEDEVYGPPESPIKFSDEPANVRQAEGLIPSGRRNPWRQ